MPNGYKALPFDWYGPRMTPLERDHERGLNGALAAEIRAELAVQDKSQTWLAEATEIDRLTLRRYLKAQRALNTATIEVIAAALDVEPGELMLRAAERRNKYPDLYGPQATALTVYLGATGAESDETHESTLTPDEQAEVDAAVAAVDDAVRRTRPARTKEERQQMLPSAARKDQKRR